jgi:uncharacterized protein
MPPGLKPLSKLKINGLSKLLGPSDNANFSLVEFDGFIHGSLCLPRTVMPAEWLPQVIPDGLTSRRETERVAELLVRYYNRVVGQVLAGTFDLHCDGSGAQCHDWLSGFAHAFGFDDDALETLSAVEAEELDDDAPLTAILLAFSLEIEALELKEDREDMREIYDQTRAEFDQGPAEANLEMLTEIAADSYRMLEEARRQAKKTAWAGNESKGLESGLKSVPKVGRNQACPCGSGKKYKHCHGANVQA